MTPTCFRGGALQNEKPGPSSKISPHKQTHTHRHRHKHTYLIILAQRIQYPNAEVWKAQNHAKLLQMILNAWESESQRASTICKQNSEVSTKWQPGLIKHNQADPQKTSTNTRTCTVITLWTPSGSPLESPTKWRAFNFLESGNMYLYYISTFYGPQAHPFCRGIWRGYIIYIHCIHACAPALTTTHSAKAPVGLFTRKAVHCGSELYFTLQSGSLLAPITPPTVVPASWLTFLACRWHCFKSS